MRKGEEEQIGKSELGIPRNRSENLGPVRDGKSRERGYLKKWQRNEPEVAQVEEYMHCM